MLKFLSKCFTFKGIFSLRDYKKGPVIFLFLILVFVTSFPLNMAIIKNNGWKGLNTVTYAWRTTHPTWLPSGLPNDYVITKNGLEVVPSNDVTYVFETTNQINDKEVVTKLIINPLEIIDNKIYDKNNNLIYDYQNKTNQRAIVLSQKEIIYYGDDNILTSDYKHVPEAVNFTNLKLDINEGGLKFLDIIDGAFSDMMIISNLLINTGTQLLLNTIFVIVEAAIFLLVRIKYQRVTNFSQNINIVIASMIIPSIISFIAGILNIIEFSSFTVVLFQLLAPLIAIGAIYKGSNIKDPLIKHTA